MKRSISSKIILSYILVIIIALLFTGLFFGAAVNRYLGAQTQKGLAQDARSIAEILKKDMNYSESSEKSIRQIIRNSLLAGQKIGAIESKWVVVGRNKTILYPKLDEDIKEEFTSQVLPKLSLKPSAERNSGFSIKINGEEYLGAVMPVRTGTPVRTWGWVVLYAPAGSFDKIIGSMLIVLAVSLAVSGLASAILGIFIARSISKPVKLLKQRAERLSRRDFDSIVTVKTGDELEELAQTIDTMADELKEYDKAQAKFLQNASHELKTPLMSIQGYAEGIKDGVFEDNEKALQIIMDESKRLKTIVEDLIFLSKLEYMEEFYAFSRQSINKIISDSAEKVNSLALMKNISISLELVDDVPVNCDGEKLTQALINIIGNCIRYAKSNISISSVQKSNCIEIVISDDGEGFAEKEPEEAFKRFYKGRNGGTGLGLAITKAVIDRHKGTISASNGERGGARFDICIPV